MNLIEKPLKTIKEKVNSKILRKNPSFDQKVIEDENKPEDEVEQIGTTHLHHEEEWTEHHRETWTGRFDFFLSALGYAVGLGAVWRFPYLCYRNGGGVFLIPYFIFLVLVGIPLVFLEMVAGQFTSNGPLTSWTMVPIFRGVGLSMNIVNAYLSIYYNMIIAYSLYFLVLSFTSKLPWQKCNPSWSSYNCIDDYSPEKFRYDTCDRNDTNTIKFKCDNGRCLNVTNLDPSQINCDIQNTNTSDQIAWWNPTFPSQDYWNKVVLWKSNSIDEPGTIVWQLIVALIIAWLIVWAMVVRGIKVSGKLGIRGWMLPGAEQGIKFYIFPEMQRLKDIQVWKDAASQIFFTLSVSYGGLVALASYNEFNTNVMRDAIVVSLSNCLTSVYAGFVIFAYMGYLAQSTGQTIDKVVQSGQGLSFIVFPFAVTTIPGAPFWSILFFVMMIVLGMDTMMASVETTITSVLDFVPKLRKNRLFRVGTISTICFVFLVLGITFTLRSGTYWIEILDTYSGSWAVLLLGAIECVSVAWFYGFGNFKKDISIMLKKDYTKYKLFYIWNIFWFAISPALLIILVVLSFRDLKQINLNGYIFPFWTHVIGQLITSSVLAGVVFWALYTVIDALFINKRPLLSLIKPDYSKWKPKKLSHQKKMAEAHGFDKDVFQLKKAPKSVENGIDNMSYETQNNELRF